MKRTLRKSLAAIMAVLMLFCALPLGSFASDVKVPEDAVEFNGNYYKIYNQKRAWHDAKAYCEKIGGHLATITSKEENDFVYGLVRNTGIVYWLGGTDEEQEGVWKWVTGEEWVFDNLDHDNRFNQQDYLTINYLNRDIWDDQSDINDTFLCNVGGFICEWEAEALCKEHLWALDIQNSAFKCHIAEKSKAFLPFWAMILIMINSAFPIPPRSLVHMIFH